MTQRVSRPLRVQFAECSSSTASPAKVTRCCCLRQNTYDVLIACERAVDGSGLDLLGRTTRTAVPLKRIFAAAPERLQLLGPRLAPFKVQRTINYPIDLEELWLAIAQVTGGPNDETDGTIERVVLDERGIPAVGTTPRAPIPSRPPAPLGGMRSAPAPATFAPAGTRHCRIREWRPHRRRESGSAGSRTAAARAASAAPAAPGHAPGGRRGADACSSTGDEAHSADALAHRGTAGESTGR